MKRYKIYYDTNTREMIIGYKGIEKISIMKYMCTASLEEIDDEIYKRERVNLEYRFKFKKIDISELDEISKLLKKVK